MNIIKVIEKKIRDVIDLSDIKIIDNSVRHVDHYLPLPVTSPSHVELILISDDFIGMSVLNRHKLVYKLLKSEIERVHAISLKLYTRSEYDLKNKVTKR